MFDLPFKKIFITCLICSSLNDCAYLVVGPLELSRDSFRNDLPEDAPEPVSKTVPKRESKTKIPISSTANQRNLDDAEIIEEIPFCTNLFRSSVGKETKNAKTSDNCEKISQKIKEDVNFDQENDQIDQKTIKNEEKTTIIDNLKRELAKEREKVQNLTNELKFVKKLCEESSFNYMDYDYESNDLNNDKIQSIQSSLDLYNLINSNNKFKMKTARGNKESNISLNEKFGDNIDIIDNKNASQILMNNEKINKNLFKDNVYQIPNFSVNDHKNFKHPNILNDLPILQPHFNRYPIPIHNPNIMLPYKNPNQHSDILRTLYPQFFLDDPNDNYDPITNPKRASGRCWMEPEQIYANNMKQLTAPYKIFPGHLSPDLRYFNIRDRRNYNDKVCENFVNNNKINLNTLLRRRKNNIGKIINRRNFEPFKRISKTQISAKVENDSKCNGKKSLDDEIESLFKTLNSSNEGTELDFKGNCSSNMVRSAFTSNDSSKLASDPSFISEVTKVNENDSENDDDDEKTNYYESSRGSLPYRYMDFIDSKKHNDIFWNGWRKENELRNKIINLNVSDDKNNDKVQYFESNSPERTADIVSKEVKLGAHCIHEEKRNNDAPVKINNNNNKCPKSAKSPADDIDDDEEIGRLKENDDVKETADDDERYRKEESILPKSTDDNLRPLKHSGNVLSKTIAKSVCEREEMDDKQPQMESFDKSVSVNKTEDDELEKEIVNGNDSVTVSAEDTDSEKMISEDNGPVNILAGDSDATKVLAHDNGSVKPSVNDINPMREIPEVNGVAEMVVDEIDPAKGEAEDNESSKEAKEENESTKGVKDSAQYGDSVKMISDENDKTNEIEDDDSLDESNCLTDENEKLYNADNKLLSDIDDAINDDERQNDDIENDETKSEHKCNRRKKNE